MSSTDFAISILPLHWSIKVFSRLSSAKRQSRHIHSNRGATECSVKYWFRGRGTSSAFMRPATAFRVVTENVTIRNSKTGRRDNLSVIIAVRNSEACNIMFDARRTCVWLKTKTEKFKVKLVQNSYLQSQCTSLHAQWPKIVNSNFSFICRQISV